jgi:hypothetical protein
MRTAPQSGRRAEKLGDVELALSTPRRGRPQLRCAELLAEAQEAADNLLTMWRERKRLEHCIRLARLKAELTWLDEAEQAQLEKDVAEFTALVVALSERSAA